MRFSFEDKGFIFVIVTIVVVLITATFYLALMQPETERYNPATQMCIERNDFFLPEGSKLAFSCLSVYVQDYPACCKDWIERPHADRYSGCIDDMFFARRLGLFNSTDTMSKMFTDCLYFDKKNFTETIKTINDEYQRRYNSTNSTGG